MQIDVGSRDVEFIETIASIRSELLQIVHVPAGQTTHTTVLLQGPGSYAVEAVFANFIGNTTNVKVINLCSCRREYIDAGIDSGQRVVW